MKRTPLRLRRPTPRRSAPDRIKQVRVKPKAGAGPNAAERQHMDRVAALPCLVRGDCAGRVTLHHVSSDGYKRIARSHQRVTPLCERHHQIQHGPRESVEALGHGGFTERYGIDLLAEADRLWHETEGI